ncbi:MAG TPA: type I-U CRISPR-associated protein Csb2 [Pirellulales bacterium]|nr:type I-U CRISPR-associated protein Csb2 [Pirellulales bacterium]
MLALGIRYLTGYAIATDVSRGAPGDERAEWPPHPARVFMALAAAMFEAGENGDERAVLEWLEQQGAPSMRVSDAEPRDVVTCFVPVNDSSDPIKGKKALTPLQSVALGRDRQARTFPRVRPSDDTVFLCWRDAQLNGEQCAILDRLCEKVTRIGHSSSLVQMWVEGRPPEPNLLPADYGERPMRIASTGTLGYLAAVFNGDAIEAYAQLHGRMATAHGKAKKQLKQELAERFDGIEPMRLHPTISQWQPYHTHATVTEAETVSGVFDRELLILSKDEGPVIGLGSTWHLLTALHKTIIKQCDPARECEWLSGHKADGAPTQQPHLALLPLAFVDREHADGHIMGIALAFPKGIEPRERGRALRGLIYDDIGQPKTIDLILGSLGKWTLTRETRLSPPGTLQVRAWTEPSDTWATVTPIVLDRHPKVERAKDRQQWSLDVAEIVAESCERQGLPRPVGVDVDKTSWFRGAPRAVAGNGGGFSLMPVKQGQSQRQQVHAWLRFEHQIEGPLLLGAGRFRGYGLCRPWKGKR